MAQPNDELGTLVAHDVKLLESVENPYDLFVSRQGRGDFTTLKGISHHPAHDYLNHVSKRGAPVILSPRPWSKARNDAAMARGPHKSAFEYQDFLRGEMVDFVRKAFWMVLPYRSVQEIEALVSRLRVSPIGVVPQHDRRPRIIVDYSFWGLNDETVKLSAQEAMQFARALERIMAKVVHADPRYGPVKFIKIDIADGFYRIHVRAEDIPKLGVAFPHREGEEPLIAFPLVLPMGWTESPPYFCAATETICDIATERLLKWRDPPPHRLEHHTQVDVDEKQPTEHEVEPTLPSVPVPTRRDPLLRKRRPRQLAYFDVFVDDFLAAAQGDTERLNRIRRILMDAIDLVLRPVDDDDPSSRLEPISVKKLKQGDATWSSCKKLLGWIVDAVAMTLTLPPRRLARLAELLAQIPLTQSRLSLKKWHGLLGELRSMAIAIPGARGLFSQLQHALKSSDGHRLRLHRGFHDAIEDFRWLHHDLSHRPTRLYELVPVTPTLSGSHDASGIGAGGVWLPNDTAVPRDVPLHKLSSSGELIPATPASPVPIVWRLPFPRAIREQLVSQTNRSGELTNSDLELAGSLLHDDAAVQCFDVRERTIKSSTDNLATLYWSRKGSVTGNLATALLLRILAIHQRFHRHVALRDYIPANALASMDPECADEFRRDYGVALEAVQAGVVSSRSQAADGHWDVWEDFCAKLSINPTLQEFEDPIPFLQVFAVRYRSGAIAPSKRQVRSRTVENALRSVGQTFAAMGSPDPRLTTQGKIDFRIQRQLASYTKKDPPPDRVKPIPLAVIRNMLGAALVSQSCANMAVADMIIIAFFFLLRPGEYTGTHTESTPFRLCDVQLFVGRTRLNLLTATDAELDAATFVSLTFTTQKNGVPGEVVGLSRSGEQHLCPVLSTVRRVKHLRSHNCPLDKPIATYFEGNKFHPVTAADITSVLQLSVAILGPSLGFLPTDISARSLRAAGAMALLCAKVDTDVIRLIGRWRSDEMLRYLTVQAEPIMRHLSSKMLSQGSFILHPGTEVPMF